MTHVTLTDRGLVSMAGPDAETLLQDVISCDVTGLSAGHARPGALLTPQGKILFEFLLSRRDNDGFLLDLPREQIDAFIKRMTIYRLRAKVEIQTENGITVAACWDCRREDGDLVDERFRDSSEVFRRYRAAAGDGSPEDYARLRIRHGVAESGSDYDLSDAFPHDILMDLNGGVSMTKGCYVGQEVVSRMQHRGTARRRIVQVEGEQALPANRDDIQAEGRTIGRLGTVVGREGLALVRIDRVARARDAGHPITTDGQPVRLSLPRWTGLQFPRTEPAEGDSGS